MAVESIVLYATRSNGVKVIDPESLPRCDEFPPIIEIVGALMSAGYYGVAVDEIKLANGRFILGVEVDPASHEGRILQATSLSYEAGAQLPSSQAILDAVAEAYAADRSPSK
jgi:hypothetical protein